MRRFTTSLTVLVFIATMVAPVAVAATGAFPDVIPLPDGWRPEGITLGKGAESYVGSLGTGAIYRVDLASGDGEIAVPPQEGRIAVGLAFDARSGLIYAAGGNGGAGYVYDAGTGQTAAVFPFAGGFVNDVVVTRDAAYFTDSFRPFIYKVPLGPAGVLPDHAAVEAIPLGGDFVFVPGAFNANGIVATPNGKSLIIVHSGRGELYVVAPDTGAASLIDLGSGSVINGDGLALVGHTLYVMQNRLNQVGVVELSPDLSEGAIIGAITDSDFDVPTTIAVFGDSLYAVNARFGTPPTPDTEYDIVRVER